MILFNLICFVAGVIPSGTSCVTTERTAEHAATTETEVVTAAPARDAAGRKQKIKAPKGYRLVWHDEFDSGETLGPDWTYEVKKEGWVNNELQNYIKDESTVCVNDGKLCINCYKGSDGKIYSGRVNAKEDTGWKYGYFEARIMLPKGRGSWPAFWMMPAGCDYAADPWPGCGEIDIMEEVGCDPDDVTSTIHCTKYNNGSTPVEHGVMHIDNAEGAYHIYACEWTPKYLKFLVDGMLILKYDNDATGKDAWPYDKPFHIILNLAWGGAWGGYKGVDNSALPVSMKVDYVRVYQKKRR